LAVAWGCFVLPLESSRPFHCVFLPDVLCSFRKSQKVAILDRCWECSQYQRFMKEMIEEDMAEAEEVLRIQKYGYPKRFDVPKE